MATTAKRKKRKITKKEVEPKKTSLRLQGEDIKLLQAIQKRKGFSTENGTVLHIIREYTALEEALNEEKETSRQLREDLAELKYGVSEFKSAFNNLVNVSE